MRLLVTGFGPFPRARCNPTAPLVMKLAESRALGLSGLDIIPLVLPTRWGIAERLLLDAITASKPDAVLMFGLASRTRFLRVEIRAKNRATVIFPDVGGVIADQQRLERDEAFLRHTRLKVPPLVTAARRCGLLARASIDAGAYLCNATYFTALGAGTPVIFIHVPRPRAGGPTPDDLARAAMAITRALKPAVRRCQQC